LVICAPTYPPPALARWARITSRRRYRLNGFISSIAAARGVTRAAMDHLADLTGKTIGKYRIVKTWARRHGRVYQAYQTTLDRYVALKVILPYLKRMRISAAFRYGAKCGGSAASQHRAGFDYDVEAVPYMVMEYIRGLAQDIAGEARPAQSRPAQAVRVAREVAQALFMPTSKA
jgi:hypothetical protein